VIKLKKNTKSMSKMIEKTNLHKIKGERNIEIIINMMNIEVILVTIILLKVVILTAKII